MWSKGYKNRKPAHSRWPSSTNTYLDGTSAHSLKHHILVIRNQNLRGSNCNQRVSPLARCDWTLHQAQTRHDRTNEPALWLLSRFYWRHRYQARGAFVMIGFLQSLRYFLMFNSMHIHAKSVPTSSTRAASRAELPCASVANNKWRTFAPSIESKQRRTKQILPFFIHHTF